MGFPELETKRLKLVQLGEEHIPGFYDIMSRDEVTKYYGMESLKNLEEAARIIESFRTNFENKRAVRWGILLKDTEDFAGTVGLNNLHVRGKRAEIGYELHPSHWNKGITTEAVKEVLRYAFEELDLFRMGAVTFTENKTSIQLLKRLGFKEEGILRGYLFQNNQSHDGLVFSLLKTEW
ncbi:GNAT family N-acetyltransferase [Bacillus marinisedimentorum]|uniref:GNAT family N-acetyltransferase n=1 Tax=Bacillus marinisedimentorum TaxID=1821260 RepID=UPI0007E04988|nr:GNAT family N-acetyltransferase [Bacillus marinisedimentorum]